MKNLNDTLPELMRRATENLEPESTDLVERGMARGLTLRRRRTALFTATGATAVVATAAVIVGGNQLFAKDAPPPAASTTTKQSTTITQQAPKPATLNETKATLIKLLPARLKVAKAQVWDDGGGYQAELLVNDGKGLSLLSLAIRPPANDSGCSNQKPGTCTTRADGSRLTVMNEEIEERAAGVLFNHVYVVRPSGQSIVLSSFNGSTVTRKGAVTVEKTRAKPALTTAELIGMVDSRAWRFPPKLVESNTPDKPQPTSPGVSKPPVPVQQTLQTLRAVLPKGLQVTQPTTRGGLPDDYNAASVLVDDGKGKSYVEAFVTYEVPMIKKCGVEGAPNHCKVLPGGGVAGWDKNSPEYSDARQAKEGVLGNTAVIRYADGRYISITSYNAVGEKGSKHTRPRPAISVEKLLEMAGDKDWKFPGTKK
ncbi:hypothetical protein [Kribbella sp. NPDC051620]|uniref:hypothetical protein n=1 Tax=Kribbella sp. NPDC051620 TaxID=3364120 RepID=UPI0037B1C7C1